MNEKNQEIIALNDDAGESFLGVVFMVYDYESGSYDGNGTALYKNQAGKWGVEYLGHCSCYGPFDSFDANDAKFNTLDEVLENASKEFGKELLPLIAKARERGYA